MFSYFVLIPTLMACIGGEPETPVPTPLPSPTAPEPAVEEPKVAASEGFIVGSTMLRKSPSDDKKIPDPAGGEKQISNYVTSLNRGELVSMLGEEGEWSNLRASDSSEGWVKTNRIVPITPEVKISTMYTEGKVFQRPDLLSLDSTKKIVPGSIVFLIQEKDQFAEVDYPRSASSSSKGWTLKSDLVFEASDVEAAKIITKVLQLRADGDAGAKQLEDLARSQFAGSQLLSLLDTPAPAVTDAPVTDAPATDAPATDATPD